MKKDVNVYSFYDECYVSLVDFRKLEQENKRLKDNWNNLKEDLELIVDYGSGDEASRWDKVYGGCAKDALKFMQELEQGDNK